MDKDKQPEKEEECEMCQVDPATLAQLKGKDQPSSCCRDSKKGKKSIWKKLFRK